MSNIWSVFGSVFIDFRDLLASKLEASWGHAGHKILKEATSKTKQKQTSKMEVWLNGRRILVVLKYTENNPQNRTQGWKTRPHS